MLSEIRYAVYQVSARKFIQRINVTLEKYIIEVEVFVTWMDV